MTIARNTKKAANPLEKRVVVVVSAFTHFFQRDVKGRGR
jgi:hypothetical protein